MQFVLQNVKNCMQFVLQLPKLVIKRILGTVFRAVKVSYRRKPKTYQQLASLSPLIVHATVVDNLFLIK